VADPFVLAYLEDGCIAALNYSNRLLEFSLGIFVISLSTVILPNLAKNVSERKMGDYLKLLVSSLKLVVFISVPATAGLICLRRPAISLLFESGLFDDRSVTLVSTALLYHAIGLTMIGLYRILSPAFYALKDTRTPVVAAAVSLAVNLLLCATLPPFLGIGGIALAATVASGANALFLILRIRNRVPGFRLRELWPPLWKSTAASLLMGGLLVLYGRAFFAEAAGRGALSIRILSSIALGSIVYFAAAALLRMEETRLIRRKIRERLKR
jgi:putative peptidoglycan lipid II flippase